MITSSHILLKVVNAIRNNLKCNVDLDYLVLGEAIILNQSDSSQYAKYEIYVPVRTAKQNFKVEYPITLYNEPMSSYLITYPYTDFDLYLIVIYDKVNQSIINDAWKYDDNYRIEYGNRPSIEKIIDADSKEVSIKHSDSEKIINDYLNDKDYQINVAKYIINEYLQPQLAKFELPIE